MQEKLKAKKIDHIVFRELCANLIIRHGLPLNFFEYKKLNTWISYLNPDAILVSRNTIKNEILRIFMKEKSRMKEKLNKL